MNVMINLSEVEDVSYCETRQEEVDSLIDSGEAIHKKVFEKTIAIIKS